MSVAVAVGVLALDVEDGAGGGRAVLDPAWATGALDANPLRRGRARIRGPRARLGVRASGGLLIRAAPGEKRRGKRERRERAQVRIAGNSTTSRRLFAPVSSITNRSIPRPTPPVGGIPDSSARM